MNCIISVSYLFILMGSLSSTYLVFFEALNQAVKIVIVIEFNFDLAFSPVLFNRDFGAEVAGKILGQAG